MHGAFMLTRARVLAIDDYLPCAPVARWLPGWLEGRRVGICGPTLAAAAPRVLRGLLAALPVADGSADELEALVHLGPFDLPLDADVVARALGSLALGGAVLDIAFARGLFVRPTRRTAVFDATARRFEAWGRLGLARLEQWVTADARGLVITHGVAAVR
jgi:hypothetical protein